MRLDRAHTSEELVDKIAFSPTACQRRPSDFEMSALSKPRSTISLKLSDGRPGRRAAQAVDARR